MARLALLVVVPVVNPDLKGVVGGLAQVDVLRSKATLIVDIDLGWFASSGYQSSENSSETRRSPDQTGDIQAPHRRAE